MKREVFTLIVHDDHVKAVEGLRLYTLEEEGKVQIQYWWTGKELNDCNFSKFCNTFRDIQRLCKT